MIWVRRVLIGVLALVVLLVAALAVLLGTAPGSHWVVARALDAVTDVRVERIEGTVLDRLTLHGVEVSDSTGTWLTARTAIVDWRPTKLLGGRLWIDLLTVSEVNVARPPEAQPEGAEDEGGAANFDLLERVTLHALTLDGVHLAAPVLGTSLSFRAAGQVTGAERGGIESFLEAQRLDAPGEARLEVQYRPGGVLGVHLAVYEPPGGAVARLLDLPGLPGVRLSLNGEGPVSEWDGAMLAEAEDFVTIEADLHLSSGDTRTATIAATLRPGPQMPAEISNLTGEALELAATLRNDGAGTLSAEDVRVRGQGWTLDGTAQADENMVVNGQAVLDITDGTGLEALAGVPVGQARLEARMQGPLDGLEVALDGTVTDTVVRRAEVRARGVLGGDAVPFSAEGRVEGVGELVPQAAPIVGEGLDFAVTGTFWTDTGDIGVERLTVQSPVIGAEYVGTIGTAPLQVAGGLEASVTDLSALEPLTGVALRGVGTIGADLKADQDTIVGDLRLTLRDFATGIPQADALVAGQVDATSGVEWHGQEVRLRDLHLRAPGASLDASLALNNFNDLGGTFVLEAPELGRLNVGVEGAVRAEGTFAGTLAAPVVAVTVGGQGVQVVGVGVRQPSAALRLTAQGMEVTKIDALVAGVRVAGQVAMPFEAPLLDGAFTLKLESPEDLAALTGQPLTGSLNGELTLAPVGGTQGLSARLFAEALALPDAGVLVTSLQARAQLRDLFGAPDGTITVTAGDGGAGGVAWQDAALRADLDDGGGAFSVTVQGTPTAPYVVETAGRLELGEVLAVRLNTLRVANPDHAVRLVAPTTVTLKGTDIAVAPTRLNVDGGALDLEARLAGGAMTLTVSGREIPLDVLELVVPDYPVRGTVAVDLHLSGPLDGPSGRMQLRTSPLALPEAGVQGLMVDAEADIGQGRLSGRARFSGLAPEPAIITADVPLVFSETGVPSVPATQPLTIGADWRGPVQAIWDLVPQIGHRVTGQAVVQARLTGSLEAPEFAGEASLADGSYENLEWGTVLRQVQVTAGLTPTGDVSLNASATDGGAGRLSVDGTIDNSQPGASQVNARITLQQVQAVRRDDLRAGISGEVTYDGTLDAGIVRGDLTTETVRLTLGASLGGGVPELDVVEVNRAALGDPNELDVEERAEGPAFGRAVALDIRVRMPNRIYVTGQGLESEWRGDLNISGTLADARISGALQVVRGTFAALNRSFALENGTVEFTGGESIDPAISLRAVHEAEDITAIVLVTGRASDPQLALESRPALPEDEIIARVLFGREMGALGPAEGLAVAQMAARMAGIGGSGPGVLEQVRGALALDVLSVGGGADGPTVEAGRYIGENVYVGVEGGGSGSGSVEVEVELAPGVTLETRGSARSGADIGVQWKFDY